MAFTDCSRLGDSYAESIFGVGELIADPNLTDQESAKVALRGEVVGQVWMNGRGGGRRAPGPSNWDAFIR
jgi:hypothetical protein